MFESLRLFEKVYLECAARMPANRKLRVDIDATDSKYMLFISEIVKSLMKRGDGVQLKLNKVSIETNKLSSKPL
jgi:hypothetical protein